MKYTRGFRILSALRSTRAREHVIRTLDALARQPDQTCPCCGHHGQFDSFGDSPRMGANCTSCESKERHRLFALATSKDFLSFAGLDVLHFAPEPPVRQIILSAHPKTYTTADFEPGRAELELNIEAISLPDESFDRVVCSHVLEHVDDEKALAELYRVLRPGGQAIVMIPIVEGWDVTYEDTAIVSPKARELHFLQWDHVRLYGADFRKRAISPGFRLDEYTAGPNDSIEYGLMRGEKIFKLSKDS